MNWIKRIMERGQPPVAAPYATTPNGAPFPLRSWPPDAAIDIQNLATWADLLANARASGFVQWPSTSCPMNWNVVSHTPTTKTARGGLTISTNGAAVTPVAGLYQIQARVFLSSGTSTTRSVAIATSPNGSAPWTQAAQGDFTSSVTGQTGISIVCQLQLAAGVSLLPQTYIGTAGTLDLAILELSHIGK